MDGNHDCAYRKEIYMIQESGKHATDPSAHPCRWRVTDEMIREREIRHCETARNYFENVVPDDISSIANSDYTCRGVKAFSGTTEESCRQCPLYKP